jgi:hypothetical protein
VDYGRDPPTIRSYEPGESRVAMVAHEMEKRIAFLDDIRYHLEQAQVVQKRVYEQHHRSVSFQVGEWALRLRQQAAASLPRSATGKLKPQYVGSYQVTKLINEVAMRLQLPLDARLHDVFHARCPQEVCRYPTGRSTAVLPPLLHGVVVPTPARVTRARLARGVRQVLVEWQGEPPALATWEDLDDLHARLPSFQLEDELDFEAGRDVMCGRTYARRRRACDLRRAAKRAGQALHVLD